MVNTALPLDAPLRLDADNESVWRGEQSIQLTPTAFSVMTKTEERQWEAELHRLKGELTLQQANQKSHGTWQKEKPAPSP